MKNCKDKPVKKNEPNVGKKKKQLVVWWCVYYQRCSFYV